ncbi:hypothetical protein [Arsenophonus nasoniae]|uniref:Uncharacterized protein n=1 Tax=Arsenophonus nasoniae TaxID=638 RepID=D2U2E5_9GAMM|nr:hypothetical protein [Arsenophonus nasoniae]QBY41998.1 hypothetical protein ArsFIN_05310 [Arsenophonus nasoniae]WGM06193.1 hypothetical protein QE258_02135 [Arsenophonus nasoniae]CBA75188.1 hypothetical protein ARN_27640 [Arsenophonus nasoniae]
MNDLFNIVVTLERINTLSKLATDPKIDNQHEREIILDMIMELSEEVKQSLITLSEKS